MNVANKTSRENFDAVNIKQEVFDNDDDEDDDTGENIVISNVHSMAAVIGAEV